MGKVFLAVVVAIASFALVESLSCNQCSVSLFGFCLSFGSSTCGTNQTCYTQTTSFPALSVFKGVVMQGCRANDTFCNYSNTTALVGINVQTVVSCCSTDKCNTVNLSGAAPDLKMTFLVTMVGATMASMWGSFL